MVTPEVNNLSLAERLRDPETAAALHRLLDRADDLERLLTAAVQAEKAAADTLAMATDVVDDACRQAGQRGIDLEQRAAGLARLLQRATEPEALAAAESLLERLTSMEKGMQFLDEAPGLMAILVDVFDEWHAELTAEGIDLEACISQGLRVVLWLAQRISEFELDRFGNLLRSQLLAKDAMAAFELAGASLAKCHETSCHEESPPRVGVFGMLKAVQDPEVQRAVGFVLHFVRCFGQTLAEQGQESNHGNVNTPVRDHHG